MNSSVQPPRRIASNLLWRRGELLRDPVVRLTADGRIAAVDRCAAPDREPFTEFYAGVLVADFPADSAAAFRRLAAMCGRPLDEALRAVGCPAREGVAVVLSGLDYATLRLTARLRMHVL